MSTVEEAPDFLEVLSDGSVKRFVPGVVPASPESTNGFKSKDVIIDSSKPITGRIFLPGNPTSLSKLPVVVYFHGGGFCIGSTTWPGYHHFLGGFSVASQSIVISVDYRLAPENRLPIAYEDCYCTLDWLGHQASSEPWLDQADLSRVFLSGDSAGGNISHNVAEGSNRDYFGCNFEKTQLSATEWIDEFPAVAVYVAGLDFLKERGVMYAEFLQKKGVKEVKLVEAEKESHVFHVFHPESEATRLLERNMTEFIRSH